MNMPVYSGNKGTLITLEAEEKILAIDETKGMRLGNFSNQILSKTIKFD